LTLARHPDTPIRTLNQLSWGHSFGLEYAATTPLGVYLLLNFLSAASSTTPTSKSQPQTPSELMALPSYQRLLPWATGTMDYDAQNMLQWRYFGVGGKTANEVFADVKKQKEYMRECWEVFYRYDMLMRECGMEVDWEILVCRELYEIWRFPGLCETW
jgi:hypothetical protein